ncbi:MAG: class I SAM-dependent DNA methyltransferase [Bacillota bacterium]
MLPYEAFAACYDALMSDVDYEAWAAYIIGLIRENGAPDNTLLDAACGTGSLTVLLSKAGFAVTGADASPAMLGRAAEKARMQGQPIGFICQDLRELSLHKPVSVVNCSLDGVNYLTTTQDANKFFACAARALKQGGLLLFDVSTPYKFENVIGENTFADETEGAAYIWFNAYEAETGICTMQLTLFIKEADACYRRYEEEHVQRAHTLEELEQGLQKSGLKTLGAYAFLRTDPAGKNDERWQIIARKV